ncbi:hypothetical protein [Erwinia sp. V71]|uniref:hypothetical protein n=1 Tax=Erwinia sp. V71 TaxID=3369424 RepID=UPI003F6396F5
MHSTLHFVSQLQQLWHQESHSQHHSVFWLTPEQRAAIIRELLYPVAEKSQQKP